MSSEHNKIVVNISEEDFELYTYLKDKLKIKSNIELFTMAALFGKFIVKSREKLTKSKSYFRINDNLDKNEMVILKCLGISEDNDFNIINSKIDIFTICEEYANTGIKELYNQYENSGIDFNVSLARELMDEIKNIES